MSYKFILIQIFIFCGLFIQYNTAQNSTIISNLNEEIDHTDKLIELHQRKIEQLRKLRNYYLSGGKNYTANLFDDSIPQHISQHNSQSNILNYLLKKLTIQVF